MRTPDPLQPAAGWHHIPQPRLTPPPPSQRGLFFRSLALVARRLGRTEIPDIFPVLNIHRGLFPAWLWFASRLMPYGKLPAPVRELLILRTAWNCRCRYEWGQHVDLALVAGVSDADILATTRGAAGFADRHYAVLMQACDELCQQDAVSGDVWQALQKNWDEASLIEIMLLVGNYRMLAGFLNSSGLVLEAPIELRVQAFLQRVANDIPAAG